MTTTSSKNIEKELKEYIQALASPEIEITPVSTLKEMGIDSIALVKIFVFIEKKFGVSLINAGLTRENIETFGSLVELIATRQ